MALGSSLTFIRTSLGKFGYPPCKRRMGVAALCDDLLALFAEVIYRVLIVRLEFNCLLEVAT